MEELLKKAKIDKLKLRRLFLTSTATELSKLSEPCYYPSLKKHYYEMLHISKLTDKDITLFTKRFYKGHKAAKWKLYNINGTNFLIFLMYYFLKEKDQIGFISVMNYLAIRFYTNLMFKQMKFCNEDTFRYTLETLTKTHLFSREGTISNGLLYLSKVTYKRYMNGIKNGDVQIIVDFLSMFRTRISQSIKSFAETYYKNQKEGIRISTSREPTEDDENAYQYQTLSRSVRVIDDIVKKIGIYKNLDKKALENARKLSKVNTSLTTLILHELTDLKYSQNIKLCLELFIKNLNDVRMLCGPNYFKFVKGLMSIKRTNAKIYFKQQINILLLKILKEIKYKEKYDSVTSQTQFLINSFLAYYLTMSLRNSIC